MRVYCQGGSVDVAESRALALDGAREDVSAFADYNALVGRFAGQQQAALLLLAAPIDTDQNAAWIADTGPRVIDALIRGLSATELAQSAIEVCNEPTGHDGLKTGAGDMVTRAQYVETITCVRDEARRRGYTGTILAGGLANLSWESFAWYSECVPQLPPDVAVGYHGYPYGTQVEYRPWPPFRTWAGAVAELQAIASPRAVWCTEDGMHTAEEQQGRETVRKTDAEVRAWWCDRLHFGQRMGLPGYVMYQWIDGPHDIAIDRYGLHRVDGTRKDQAYAIRDFKFGRGNSMPIKWSKVTVVDGTLCNPDGTVRSLNPAYAEPHDGTFGPYHWSAMPAGTHGAFEMCTPGNGTVAYNPTGEEGVVFPFKDSEPSGYSLLGEDPL